MLVKLECCVFLYCDCEIVVNLVKMSNPVIRVYVPSVELNYYNDLQIVLNLVHRDNFLLISMPTLDAVSGGRTQMWIPWHGEMNENGCIINEISVTVQL